MASVHCMQQNNIRDLRLDEKKMAIGDHLPKFYLAYAPQKKLQD